MRIFVFWVVGIVIAGCSEAAEPGAMGPPAAGVSGAIPTPTGTSPTSTTGGSGVVSTSGGTAAVPTPPATAGASVGTGGTLTTPTSGGMGPDTAPVAGATSMQPGSGGAVAMGGAATGGSSATGATSCDGVTAKFCDDFEAQAPGQPPTGAFTLNPGEGSIVVDATKAYSGTQSIHLTTPLPGNNSTFEFTEQFSPAFDDLHGRAMFYVTAIPQNGPHWDIVYSYSQNPSVQWEIGGIDEYFYFVVDPPDHALRSNVFPTGEWFCLQWEFHYGGAGGQNSFLAKMNGEVMEKGEFTGPDPDGETWQAGPWRNLVFGWTKYGGQSSGVDIEMWIDDIAFGDAPIPCPAP